MQRPTAKHQEELGESCERVRDKTEQARGVKDTTRRPTESTNLDPEELTESELPTKEHAGAESRTPNILVTDVQLGLHVCPLRTGVAAVSDSDACHWIPFP